MTIFPFTSPQVLKSDQAGLINELKRRGALDAPFSKKKYAELDSTVVDELEYSHEAERGKYFCTALHRAVWSGFAEGARMLLDAGANPNYLDGEGKTALYLATAGGFEVGACARKFQWVISRQLLNEAI